MVLILFALIMLMLMLNIGLYKYAEKVFNQTNNLHITRTSVRCMLCMIESEQSLEYKRAQLNKSHKF